MKIVGLATFAFGITYLLDRGLNCERFERVVQAGLRTPFKPAVAEGVSLFRLCSAIYRDNLWISVLALGALRQVSFAGAGSEALVALPVLLQILRDLAQKLPVEMRVIPRPTRQVI